MTNNASPYNEEESKTVIVKEPEQVPNKSDVYRINKVSSIMFEDVNRWQTSPSENSPILGINKEIIDSYILDVHYFSMLDIYMRKGIPVTRIPVSARNMTLCHIVTTSGIIFTGDSTCLDIRKFNKEYGEREAYNKAYNKLADFVALYHKHDNFINSCPELT